VRASESLRPFLFFIGPACGLAALIEYICLRPCANFYGRACSGGDSWHGVLGIGGAWLPFCLVILVANVFDAWVPACATIFAFVVLLVRDTLTAKRLASVDRACVLVVLNWCLVYVW